MPFACIYIPNFPLAAILRAEPELRAKPVAVLEGNSPLEKVLAVNEKAAALGIAPEMTKTQAELCPQVALRPPSPLRSLRPTRLYSIAPNLFRHESKTPLA